MNFLNPFVLIGLIAAGVPILLHLLNLRRQKNIEFSTLKFLKELQKTKIRKLKLKQLLLLLLRVLIIIFAVLAFARPTIPNAIPGFESYAKSSNVILIDNSVSMNLNDNQGNRLNRAKNIAREILDNLQEGDEATVLTLTSKFDEPLINLTTNLESLKNEVNILQSNSAVANLRDGLTKAKMVLDETQNLNKHLYIISDAQPNLINAYVADTSKIFDYAAYISFVRIADIETPIDNISIDSAEVVSKIITLEKPVDIDAFITNHSNNERKALLVTLYFNDLPVATRTVDIPAQKSINVNFSALIKEAGATSVKIEIESDALDDDNSYYLGISVPEKVNICVFGNRIKDAFLMAALDGINNNNTIAEYTFRSPNEASGVDFDDYDLIIFGTGNFGTSDYARLKSYLEQGGASFIFANPEIDFVSFSNSLKELGFANSFEVSFDEKSPAKFSSVDKLHPIFDGVFKGSTENSKIVESPEILQAYLIKSAYPIIELQGAALVGESKIGLGRAIYCGLSPNLEMSNFPLKGLFPALLYRGISYLNSGENFSFNFVVGEKSFVTIPRRLATDVDVSIIDPLNNELREPIIYSGENTSIKLDYLNNIGVYKIYNTNKNLLSSVAVNLRADESNLAPISNESLKQSLYGMIENKDLLDILDSPNDLKTSMQKAMVGTELWKLFAILALLAALTELWVAKTSKNDLAEN